jgi:hypothetical protein
MNELNKHGRTRPWACFEVLPCQPPGDTEENDGKSQAGLQNGHPPNKSQNCYSQSQYSWSALSTLTRFARRCRIVDYLAVAL